ncbi:563_t:CDS:10 [Entrophospora sp. SA101]|nr:563_t:CDS:10 [Entrophospora sp. SA101]
MRCYTYGEEVPALPSNLVVTNENTSQGNKNKGLSSDEALDKLIKVANEILEEHQSHVPKKMYIKEFISRVDVILSIVSSLLMFTFYIYGIVVSDPYQFRLTSLLIEAILILLMILFNGYLYTKEKNLGTIEIYEHAKIIIEQLKNTKVVRDGLVRSFPSTLLVKGDVIEMIYGDIAPCRIKLISQEHINIDLDDHLDNNEQAPSSSTSTTMPKRTSKRLKPLGLNLLLNTNCGVLKGRELTEQHRKYSSLYLNAKTKPSRQTCMCRLGKEIGFTVDALQVFSKRKEIFTCAPCHPSLKERVRNDRWEVPSMISSIYEETDAGSYQLLSDGNLEIILDNCSDYWDGQAPTDSHYFVLPNVPDEQEIISSLEVQELLSEDPDLSRSQLIRLHRLKTGQLDANLHDFSFEDNVSREDEEKFYQDVIQGQIFLSMATVFHQPKLDVCNFIEDLKLAGIRFVLFSQTAERESKAYAERLGLETDWNSCILLSSSGDENSSGDGYLEPHDIKARLPRGIENIKDHLEDVDDIPLHVSLFAECTPEANLEMIKIFQGYGEVVCCIGSALNSFNTHAFAAADVSVAMEPTHTKAQTKNGLCHYGIKGQSPMALGASFTTLPCGLFMHYDTSLYALTDLIREARRLINGLRLGVAFMIGSLLSISLLLLLSYCFFLPPVFTGYQILWIMWAIIPTLTFSFLFNPHESDTMTTMTVKNNEHLKDLPRFLVYFFLRFSLPVLFCLGAFIICLYYFDERSDVSLIFGSYGNQGWLRWSNKEQWHVFPVRLYTEQNH